MTRRARELETILLTMYAAVPLYLTYAIGRVPLILFHAAMGVIAFRVAAGKGPELIPARVMRWLAIAYVPFYVVDAALISRSAIAASTHLVLFIAVYQPIESLQRPNQAQRILTTALIFVASLATSTHITIVLFVVAFAYLMFRQLMYISHLETVRAIEAPYAEAPSSRSAALYLAGATVIGASLFPFLPRVRSPFVQGFTGNLAGASTALSDTINFNEPRVTENDATVVARVWMSPDARSFFAPIRLRGNIYDRFEDGEWKQSMYGLREVAARNGVYALARPHGVERDAVVQMRPFRGKLFLPSGTVAMKGVQNLFEGPTREEYYTYQSGAVNLDVRMALQAEPLRLTRVPSSGYPVTPQVAALARQIVGSETRPEVQAARIEAYMARNFRYLPNPATLGRAMSLDDFLLHTRAGHCEYFAAGMVALLASLDVPARIAGGFYGGRLNPLGGYYAIRREDAHAWTEVWNGTRWLTFDATPPSLRPGVEQGNRVSEYLSALGDTVTYFWDRYILTFGLGDQIALAEDLLVWTRDAFERMRASMTRDARRMASPDYGVLLAIVVIGGVAGVVIMRRRRPVFHALAAHLAALGIEVGPSMTIEEALQRLAVARPDAARALEPLMLLYEEERFSGKRDAARARTLRKRLTELRVT